MKIEKITFYSLEGKLYFGLSTIFFIFFFIIFAIELMHTEGSVVSDNAFMALGLIGYAIFVGMLFFAFSNKVLDTSKSHVFRASLVIPTILFIGGIMLFINTYYKNLLAYEFINVVYLVGMAIIFVEFYRATKAKYS
jgi:hypothetical protein